MPSLKKNIFYSGILTTANYIFPLLTYPYVSRVLGVANIGVCNFVDSIINYFLIFSALGIGTVGIREIAKHKSNQNELQETFSKLFTINTISTTIALVVLLISMHTIPRLGENYELMWVGVLKLVFNYLLIEWFFKGLEDFKYVTNRTLIVRCVYVASVFIFVRDASDVVVYYFLLSSTIVVNAIINVYMQESL
jgi:O-antigen/teichoic acid export membrane protein